MKTSPQQQEECSASPQENYSKIISELKKIFSMPEDAADSLCYTEIIKILR